MTRPEGVTFYIDLDSLNLIQSPGYRQLVETINVRREDTPTFNVQFVQNGTVVDPGTVTLTFAVKEPGKYDQSPGLVLATGFTKSGSGTSAMWTGAPNFSGATINTALGIDSNPDNDLASISAMAEFSWAIGSTVTSTRRFVCEIENDIYRATDVAPTPSPVQGATIFLPGVVGLTGGGVTKLDGVLTAGVSVPQLFQFALSGLLNVWELVAGTDAENGTTVIRGDDYHGTTNAKVFKLRSTWAPLASPAFTDVPTAPTAAPGTNTDQIATTAFVQAAASAISTADVAYIEANGDDIAGEIGNPARPFLTGNGAFNAGGRVLRFGVGYFGDLYIPHDSGGTISLSVYGSGGGSFSYNANSRLNSISVQEAPPGVAGTALYLTSDHSIEIVSISGAAGGQDGSNPTSGGSVSLRGVRAENGSSGFSYEYRAGNGQNGGAAGDLTLDQCEITRLGGFLSGSYIYAYRSNLAGVGGQSSIEFTLFDSQLGYYPGPAAEFRDVAIDGTNCVVGTLFAASGAPSSNRYYSA